MATVTGSKRHLDITSDTLTTDLDITAGEKLFIGTTDANITSTTALVLNSTEVEKRTLGSLAFDSTSLGTAASSNIGDFVNVAGDTMTGSLGIGITSPRSILETDGTISINDSQTALTTADTLAGIDIYTSEFSYNPTSGRVNSPINRILPVSETSIGDAFGMAFYTADQDIEAAEVMRIVQQATLV
jgi:hypothetical protein